MAASLPIAFTPGAGRVSAATAAKGAGGSKDEKSLLDWILGRMQEQQQLLKTNLILRKVVEEKSGVVAPPQGITPLRFGR